MGRIIRGQTIASTHRDLSGDKIPREALKELYDQIPDLWIGTSNHDLFKGPFSKGFNKKLIELPNGELAIKMDIEVFDEEAFERLGRFSIAYTRGALRCGQGDPSISIWLNPTQFDIQEAAQKIVGVIPNGTAVDVVERVEKAAIAEAAIVFLVFAGLATATGFFNAAGAHLFEVLKNLRRKDKGTGETTIQLHANIEVENHPILVILVVSTQVAAKDMNQLQLQNLPLELKLIPEVTSFIRIVGGLHPGGELYLDHAVKNDGQVYKIDKTIPGL